MEELLTKHENVLEKKSDKDGKEKIVCKLTQHEMESKVDVVEQYIHSKKFKKELEWYTFDYSKYQPFIVEHKSNRKRLYCNVTNTILNKIPTQIERHVNGRKFKRLKANVTTTTTDTPTDAFSADQFEFAHQELIVSSPKDDITSDDSE